ncbi:MAG: hypothetical protein IPN42_16635 [Methylococcaceae bacterium]|nr:hypothetical protein [Methylococcaceae bacterium]
MGHEWTPFCLYLKTVRLYALLVLSLSNDEFFKIDFVRGESYRTMNGINFIVSLLRRLFLMWFLVPTDEILFFARKATWMWRMQKMQEQFSVKEKYPKEIRPMPLASCALTVLSGFARKDIPVLLAKCGFLPHPFGLFPIKPPVLGAA